MVNKSFPILFVLLFLSVFYVGFISAWGLNGTIYNPEGVAMNNASVNVSFYNGFIYIGSNSTYTNSSGVFNLSVFNNSTYQYKIVIKHYEDNKSNYVDYTGGILPNFPYQALQSGIDTTFYLKPAGALNITSVNATGSQGTFQYIIKDVTTGYKIDSNFGSFVSSASIIVPIDGNYSIEIFPSDSMPVSYEWNNWSSTSYNITDSGNSTYNGTTYQLNKVFNTSIEFYRITGQLFNTIGGNFTNLDNLSIIPFNLESGSMIFLGSTSGMPYNLSALNSGGTDIFNKTDGTFNMTIPGPTENANILFMASINDSGNYLIGYRNISINFSGPSSSQVNFTMYPAMGSSIQQLSQNNAANFSASFISNVSEQAFNVYNSTSYTVGNVINAGLHIEASVDYTNFNATSFSMLVDPQNSGTFYLPLINDTGLTSISIYSHSYAPKDLTSLTTSSIIKSSNNITLNLFNPKSIDGNTTDVKMALMKSNSTCDQPGFSLDNPCFIGSQRDGGSNPLSAIIGGGKVNFIMGILSTGVIVKYVNVNMIASGPPSALFDSSTTNSTSSGSFSSAMRFGSLGPKIYDYAIVSIPYDNSSLNDSGQVNISIPTFYLDNSSGVMDWNTPVWNVSSNGTNASALIGNYSNYAGNELAWQTLMNNNTCTINKSNFNSTNPCYLDKSGSRIWLRIPHFSGINPMVTGSVILTTTPTSTQTSSSSSSTSGTTPLHEWSKQKSNIFTKITPGKISTMKNFGKDIGIKEIQIKVNNEVKNVKIIVSRYDKKPSVISVEKTGKVYQYFYIETKNLAEDLQKATLTIKVEKSWISNNSLNVNNISLFKFDNTSKKWNELSTVYNGSDSTYDYFDVELTSFSYFAISEKAVVKKNETEESTIIQKLLSNNGKELKKKIGNNWIIAGIIVIILILILLYFLKGLLKVSPKKIK